MPAEQEMMSCLFDDLHLDEISKAKGPETSKVFRGGIWVIIIRVSDMGATESVSATPSSFCERRAPLVRGIKFYDENYPVLLCSNCDLEST